MPMSLEFEYIYFLKLQVKKKKSLAVKLVSWEIPDVMRDSDKGPRITAAFTGNSTYTTKSHSAKPTEK